MSKQRFIAILCTMIFLATYLFAPVSSVYAASGRSIAYEIKVRRQARAADAHSLFMQILETHFGWKYGEKYPEFYGRTYISDNKLHIDYYNIPSATQAFFKEHLECYSDVIAYGQTSHSYNYLKEIADNIGKELIKHRANYVGWGVNEIDGTILIRGSEDCLRTVRSMINDYNCLKNDTTVKIQFEKIEKAEKRTSKISLKGGLQIKCSHNSVSFGSCSIGACGLYNGQKAFVTAGHDTNVGFIYEAQNTSNIWVNVGTATVVNTGNGTLGDYTIALVNTSNAQTVNQFFENTNSSKSYNCIPNSSSPPPVGQSVWTLGAASRLSGHGNITGTITNNNYTFTTYEYGFPMITTGTVLVLVGTGNNVYTGMDGDSGAPCWLKSSNNAYCFCGVYVGGDETTANHYFIFTPYNVLNSGGFSVSYSAHPGPWTYYNTTYHRTNCTTCAAQYGNGGNTYYYYAEHTGSFVDCGPSKHKVNCTKCGELVYQTHQLNASGTKCLKCGRTGNFSDGYGFGDLDWGRIR